MTKHIHVHLSRRPVKDSERATYTAVQQAPGYWLVVRKEKGAAEEVRWYRGPGAEREAKAEAAQMNRQSHDAGFTTYDPREVARLDSEIKELESKIRIEKAPFKKKDLEQVLVKVKRERAKYHDAGKPAEFYKRNMEYHLSEAARHEKEGSPVKARIARELAERHRKDYEAAKETKSNHDAGEKFYVKNMSGKVIKVCATKHEAQQYISAHQSENLHIYTTAGQNDAFSNYPSFEQMKSDMEDVKMRLAAAKKQPDTDRYKKGNIERLTNELEDLEEAWKGKQKEEARRKQAKDAYDSEENDAYIQGYKDALKGKQPDPAFHPGGEKKPSVTAKYAAGHKQGTEDRKRKTGDAGEIRYKGYVLTPIGNGKFNVYPPAKPGQRVAAIKSGLSESEAKALVDTKTNDEGPYVGAGIRG